MGIIVTGPWSNLHPLKKLPREPGGPSRSASPQLTVTVGDGMEQAGRNN